MNLIVLGTDTDAGKTTFSLLWLAAFADDWGYWKPLETGDSDSATIHRLVPEAVVHPPILSLREAVAPLLAAKREGRTVPSAADLANQVPATNRNVLIETFGGPLSPLNETELQIELVRRLGFPCVLVASSAVGAVGRTLSALAGMGTLRPVCVVLLGERDEFAEAEIAKHGSVNVVSLAMPETRDGVEIRASAEAQKHLLEQIRSQIPSLSRPAVDLPARDAATVWHPYTPLRPATPPLPVVSSHDEFLHLADGRRLIDAVSSWWTILHGHRFPPLVAALKAAADRLDHVIFAGITHPDAVELAELLLRTCPWTGGRVFFSDNGSTAVEVALKLAYQFWCHRGESHRKLFVGFEHAYHGDTFGAMAVGRDRLFFGHFEPLLFEAAQVPLDANRLDEFLAKRGHEVAGVIVEPMVQGAGGMRMHSPETLRDLHAATARHGVLFLADEVMTGNRTGKRWAFEHAGIAPDLIAASKTLTGGMMPLAATLISPRILAEFDTADRSKTFFHGHSFTGHPLACAVAVANEKIVREPHVLERALDLGSFWEAELGPLRDHPRVADVRICGSIAAVEVRAEGGYLAAEAERWKSLAIDHGVLLRPLGNVIYAMPPLVASSESLAKIAVAMRAMLEVTP